MLSAGVSNVSKADHVGIFIRVGVCEHLVSCRELGAWMRPLAEPRGGAGWVSCAGCGAEPAPAPACPPAAEGPTLNRRGEEDRITYFKPDNPPNKIEGFSALLSDLFKIYYRK